MTVLYLSKYSLKRVRWLIRRLKTAVYYGPATLRRTPMVFGNAMPKSGSHLLTQILEGLTKLGPFVDPGFPPVNRSEGNKHLPPKKVLKNIRDMRPGDIRYGYIHSEEPFLTELNQPNRATIFIYRDPRDMIISHVFYATDMYEDHGMHRYYKEVAVTMEDRINAAIIGVTQLGFELSGVKQRYDSYRGWLNQPGILCLKFEDLILDRVRSLELLLDYLDTRGFKSGISRQGAVDVLTNSISPRKSGTFRKGVPGNWRNHFTDFNKTTFKQVAGDLLVQLGYECDQDW